MERDAISLIIKEMQGKPTMGYQLTPVRRLLSRRKEIISVGEDVKKREPFVHCWRKCKLVQLFTTEDGLEAPQKIKNNTTKQLHF